MRTDQTEQPTLTPRVHQTGVQSSANREHPFDLYQGSMLLFGIYGLSNATASAVTGGIAEATLQTLLCAFVGLFLTARSEACIPLVPRR